jgi:serine/threonine-protein kinase HipA
MKRKLDVYLHLHLVGNLVQDAHGQITFDYVEAWLNDPAAIALSHSLPLTKKHFTQSHCRGFFAGVLPEEAKREIVAKNLGISAIAEDGDEDRRRISVRQDHGETL